LIERLISFAAADEAGGRRYGAVALDADERAAALLADPEGTVALEHAGWSRGEGTVRVASGEDELVLGLAAHTSQLAFEIGPEQTVSVQAVGASVDGRGALAGRGFEADGVVWTVRGEDDAASLRTLWARLADGSLLALFALASPTTRGHGEETIGAARIASGGAVTSYAEPLLSTEYDADGSHTRATLELWTADEEGLATRGAGLRTAGGEAAMNGSSLRAAGFGWRLEGLAGIGGYEIVAP
jgi:hypothetical protein